MTKTKMLLPIFYRNIFSFNYFMFEEHIEQHSCSQNNKIIGIQINKRMIISYFDYHGKRRVKGNC